MKAIIFFVIIALLVVLWGPMNDFINSGLGLKSSGGTGFGGATEQTDGSSGQEEYSNYSPSQDSYGNYTPSDAVNTSILYAPKGGSTIDDTNVVEFHFDGGAVDGNSNGLFFQTKIIGYDTSWQTTKSKSRTVTLPAGVKEYSFLVRAGVGNLIDSTPAQRNFKLSVSPYFNSIKITNIQPKTKDSNHFLATLRSYSEKLISITGWELKSKKSSFNFPYAMKIFNSDQRSDGVIMVNPGDKIYVSGAPSPLNTNNIGFKPNKCLGFLEKPASYPLSVNMTCPSLNKTGILSLSEKCQEYILSQGNCVSIEYHDFNELGLYEDSQCLHYIENNFNYSACIADHSKDNDFFKSEWHVYMSQTEKDFIYVNGDEIRLLDSSGLTVSKYLYGDQN